MNKSCYIIKRNHRCYLFSIRSVYLE